MVEDSDIYLLILGEEYGEPMPGTGLAPTEEEWTVARNLGKPTVVFKKFGDEPRPRAGRVHQEGRGLRDRRLAPHVQRCG